MEEIKNLSFDNEVRRILGRLCFQCGSIARKLREKGIESQTKAEDEQAVVIYWLLTMYQKHGTDYAIEVNKFLNS